MKHYFASTCVLSGIESPIQILSTRFEGESITLTMSTPKDSEVSQACVLHMYLLLNRSSSSNENENGP